MKGGSAVAARKRRQKPAKRRRPGRPRRDPWIEAAEHLGGRYTEARGRRPTSIWFQDGHWAIQLAIVIVQSGSAPVALTRCSARAYGQGDLRFKIHPKGKLAGVAALLGLGGLPLRNPRLDEALVARSNRPHGVRSLLTDGAVADPLLAGHGLRLRFGRAGWWERRRLGQATRVVVAETDGRVSSNDVMNEMVSLVMATLRRLAALGIIEAGRAPPSDPALPT